MTRGGIFLAIIVFTWETVCGSRGRTFCALGAGVRPELKVPLSSSFFVWGPGGWTMRPTGGGDVPIPHRVARGYQSRPLCGLLWTLTFTPPPMGVHVISGDSLIMGGGACHTAPRSCGIPERLGQNFSVKPSKFRGLWEFLMPSVAGRKTDLHGEIG